MDKDTKYEMGLFECGSMRGPEWYIFWPEGGNYITDEEFRLPAGSTVLEEKAMKVLEQLNK